MAYMLLRPDCGMKYMCHTSLLFGTTVHVPHNGEWLPAPFVFAPHAKESRIGLASCPKGNSVSWVAPL